MVICIWQVEPQKNIKFEKVRVIVVIVYLTLVEQRVADKTIEAKATKKPIFSFKMCILGNTIFQYYFKRFYFSFFY